MRKTNVLLLLLIGASLLFACKEVEIEDLSPFSFKSITPNKEICSVREKITFSADTASSDGRDLAYLWLATGGTLYTPAKETTLWKAPEQPGMVTLTCLVTDRKTKKELRHTLQLNITAPLLNNANTNSSEALTTDVNGNVGIGTDKPEATLDVAGDLKVAGVMYAHVPKGAIIMWSGETIPKGWALCDGGEHIAPDGIIVTTPDLTDRFVVAAGGKYGIGDTGGNENVTLTVGQMPIHNHSIYDPGHKHTNGEYNRLIRSNGLFSAMQSDYDPSKTQHDIVTSREMPYSTTRIKINNSGSSLPHENRPPYYALAFIIKL